MVTVNVPTPYHQQDTDYFCGAASAQMVLASISAGALLDQAGLYNDNHSHSTTEGGWATGPDGLTWTLNNRQHGKYFVLDALDTEDSISRMICWTLHHYKVAPAALVFGWQHWIVVHGADISALPASSADHAFTINAFYVNNPWPPVPGGPGSPPPHSTTDPCGSGGNHGVAHEHIAYATWRSTYMTGVPGGHWVGKFIAVCDPSPPPVGRGAAVPYILRVPGPLISAEVAAQKAKEGVAFYKLAQNPSWQAAFELKGGAVASPPVLVQRLDHPDSYYYIVPQGTAAVAVDAHTGEYLQASIHPEVTKTLSAANLSALTKQTQDLSIPLPNQGGLLRLRPEIVTPHRTLVWKPCKESLSPFFPFQMLTQGNRQVYVRVDGPVFAALHDDGRGI